MNMPIKTDDARRVTVATYVPPTTCTVWRFKQGEPNLAFDPVEKKWGIFLREGDAFTKIMDLSPSGEIAMLPCGELPLELASVSMNLKTCTEEAQSF